MQKKVFFALIASLLVFMGFVILSVSFFGGSNDIAGSTQVALGDGVVTVQVTVEVTRVVTVVVTPTHTPVPTVPPAEIMVDDDPFLGAEDAPVKIVEFSDYRCGYCLAFYHETLFQLIDHYGDNIQFVYRDFPIFGEESVNGALAAECADDQDAFWLFHNAIFDNQALEEPLPLDEPTLLAMAESLELDIDTWQTCLASDEAYDEMVIDAVLAQNLGVRGTPAFFVNKQRLPGAQPLEAFMQVIDAELLALGIEPPPRSQEEPSDR
jgi:protein-disulfide isomerase